MTDRIAIKRLTASDCTLFEGVFRKIEAGNQKSINLNADVLTGILYPTLADVAATSDNEIALTIAIYGPGGKSAHRISRKIIKGSTYKNWRLNGEFIGGPPDDTERYDNVKPGDLAIMVFKGEAAPNGMDLIIVQQSDAVDSALHTALMALFGNKSMIAVTSAQIAEAAKMAAVSEAHPVAIAAADPEMEAALEDAAQGGIDGTGKLLKNKGSRRVSGSDLAKAKARAELTGQDGEGLVNGYLATQASLGRIATHQWASAENAIAPFDFAVILPSGERILIDAKSTRGPFENVLHLSLAEIVEASSELPYQIYRVFELNDEGGKLRISQDIRPLAKRLKMLHETQMPTGVRVDGFSVATSVLNWGAEEFVQRLEAE